MFCLIKKCNNCGKWMFFWNFRRHTDSAVKAGLPRRNWNCLECEKYLTKIRMRKLRAKRKAKK